MTDSVLNATVVKRIDITDELVIMLVKPDKPHSAFLSGQYVALGLPGSAPRPAHLPPEEAVHDEKKLIKRAYSIGSSPGDPSVLEFYFAILPQGALTSRLASLKEGDRIFAAHKITGTFTLEGTPDDSNLVLVSTGTGIAPYISMLRSESTWTPNREITIVHGVRYPRDLGYKDEILALMKNRPLRYYSIVSRAGEDWAGERGHVQHFFNTGKIPLDATRDHVFLCGNPAMIDGMEELLLQRGYVEHSRKQPGTLHLERYW